MLGRTFKFIHILWHDDTKFYPRFVKMINGEPIFFTASDHLFITPHKRVLENLPYNNVILVPDGNLINTYGKCANWIVIHSLDCRRVPFWLTKKKNARKVIWRTWGHDVVLKNTKPKGLSLVRWLKYYAKRVNESLRRRVIKNFYAVGVANNVDVLKISKQFGDMRIYPISYGYLPGRLEFLKKAESASSHHSYTRIMVGHSSWPSENHLLILEKLSKFKCENIRICLPLVYGGDERYKEIIKYKARCIFGDKVEVIDEFVPYGKYAEFLATVDVAVFASEKSTALGNIALLSYFRKKIYVVRSGDLAMGFREAGCAVYSLEGIEIESFSEFKAYPVSEAEKMKQVYGNLRTKKQVCESMKAVFNELMEQLDRE